MGSQTQRGQVIVELIITLTFLLGFFWLADSIATEVKKAQAQNRFSAHAPFSKGKSR